MHQQMFEIDPSGATWFEWAAVLVTNLGWTIAYVLMILRARKDKQFGVPFIAIALMWSYEVAFVFIWPTGDWKREIFEVTWLIFDTILLFQVGLYGRTAGATSWSRPTRGCSWCWERGSPFGGPSRSSPGWACTTV